MSIEARTGTESSLEGRRSPFRFTENVVRFISVSRSRLIGYKIARPGAAGSNEYETKQEPSPTREHGMRLFRACFQDERSNYLKASNCLRTEWLTGGSLWDSHSQQVAMARSETRQAARPLSEKSF